MRPWERLRVRMIRHPRSDRGSCPMRTAGYPITTLLGDGVNPKVVSERAGHALVAITLQLYGHVIPNMQADAAARVDAALRGTLEELI